MSAKSYQIRLKEVLSQLSVANKTAIEWKTVAENRLKLLMWIDHLAHEQIGDLVKIGTIFGADPGNPGYPLASNVTQSGDETANLVAAKLQACQIFTARLTREAVDLQSTLDSTLAIAIQATSVNPPNEDLSISIGGSKEENQISPLEKIYRDIENANSDEEMESDSQALAIVEKPSLSSERGLDVSHSLFPSFT